MPRPAREVMASLEKKGFTKKENDHTFFHLWVDGKKTTVYTKVSHGEKEIHDNLLGAMARQLRLSKKQFLELVDCPLTFDALPHNPSGCWNRAA
jgi:predicted RNA binding protein YcfA (HicA-like mRNA interferase family)